MTRIKFILILSMIAFPSTSFAGDHQSKRELKKERRQFTKKRELRQRQKTMFMWHDLNLPQK